MTLEISPVATLQGDLRPPSDKSLTHRAYMFASIADGDSVVRMPLRGEDCESTLHCLIQLGLRHEWMSPSEIRLVPPREWQVPRGDLDCGNSGTTMRLMSGLLASRPLDVTLVGDASLSRRPMQRIAEPLRMMGATVEGDTAPLHIVGGQLRGIDYVSPVASAQIKSCVLLAGLGAEGVTSVREPSPSRDHTERMLRATGVRIEQNGAVSLAGGQRPHGFEITIPADISSAAFFLVAAAMLPQSSLAIHDLSMNPTRTGILDVLRQCGVPYELLGEREELGEPVSTLEIRAPKFLKPFEISGSLVPRLIDEIPVLAVLATQCEGTSVIRDARELRVKETDRIETVSTGLRAMGAEVETFEDGLAITGPTKLKAAQIDAAGDHRIGMAFAIAGLISDGGVKIDNAESIATSYPGFTDDLMRLAII
ncbi:3-phosphoshikimate 1-carboxyvinyltransferase [Fimbriimonas ginsengisoli]|uniref:3-phosphoshikimate 1-carboxyvinyltransferase n=1 Tax=Fimbriimonas ginsengisoli Gsoil 348 TaxID=661478 RepID=A0A068NXE6_FIMGI|nr:3-phosphoshikimate 1-carboxyvinyltransferase [Fimbriimonas ginsengisoli]AIE88086.1 3-phosphoshikimate 1-carboxyvinyltransferase [Fimbriimonas ginsengisoli Gsoil 348]